MSDICLADLDSSCIGRSQLEAHPFDECEGELCLVRQGGVLKAVRRAVRVITCSPMKQEPTTGRSPDRVRPSGDTPDAPL